MSSNREYSPLKALNRTRRAINSFNRTNALPTEGALHLSVSDQPLPCAVLLRSLLEGGPVPDDLTALPKTAAAFKAHVRPDGAVYLGAFELQGDRTSIVLMFGPKGMTQDRAERIATLERPALIRRQESFALGPFAAASSSPT